MTQIQQQVIRKALETEALHREDRAAEVGSPDAEGHIRRAEILRALANQLGSRAAAHS